MYVWIPFTKLVVDKKYKIVGYHYEYIAIFKRFDDNACFPLKFYIAKGVKYQGDVLFPINMDFYEFIPQNPQWQMERRAVNLIIRRLIGDDYFEW